jgi:ABC-type sugar transport system substrate-binding protein
MPRRTSHAFRVFLIAVLLTLVAACGSSGGGSSSSDSSGSGSGTGAADAAAAKERLAPALEEPTSIDITQPLTSKPAPGKNVYWLEGNIQSILPITGGFKEAAQTLAWNLTVLTYDPADPQAPGAAMRQAIQGGAQYIAVSGQTISVLGPALDMAKAANIPVIDLYSTDEVGGAANGIYANIGGPDYSKKSSSLIDDFMISDSGGDAHILFVNDPDFAILQIVADAVHSNIKANCGQCQLTDLNVSTSDLAAGNAASSIVSRLQAAPDIDYVYVSIGDLATGLVSALQSAGLDKVKIVGGVPNKEQVQTLIDKTASAYTPLGRPESAWVAMDVMARLALGMDPDVQEHTLLPVWVWTQNNVPKPAQDYQGPKDYQAQFKKLWQIS